MSAWADRYALWERWHSYVLGCKGVDGETDLRDAIRYDQVVALAAARTLLGGPSGRSLVGDFFTDRSGVRDEVLAVADDEVVDHIGFQIREPLDVWLEGLARWAPRLEFDVVGTKRFTASDAFRSSVGSFAEMAQIWVRRDGVVAELELFDIHRRNPAGDAVRSVTPTEGTAAALAAASPATLNVVLEDDDIWHYGIRITDESAVAELHARFLQLVADDARFRLRSDDVVANAWHGSVHTKLTNLDLGIEIEFLTYRVDWQGRDRR
jgi:hypothetical protein